MTSAGPTPTQRRSLRVDGFRRYVENLALETVGWWAIETTPKDVVGWLDGSSAAAYWRGPEGTVRAALGARRTLAAAGAARLTDLRTAVGATVAAFDCSALPPAVRPFLLGGIAFDERSLANDIWREFANAELVVPEVAYLEHRGQAWWLLTAEAGEHADELERRLARAIRAANRSNTATPTAVQHIDDGSATEHRTAVQAITSAIADRRVEKAVLSRRRTVEFRSAISASRVVNELRSNARRCVAFGFRRGQSCFVGATPERLVRIRNGQLDTEALAGTIAAGESNAIGRLLASGKDRHEHEVVVRDIVKALSGIGLEPELSESPAARVLRHVVHLVTPIQASSRRVSVLDAVAALHPTPAVGGLPREPAARLIRDLEPEPRGWYASPIGWVDPTGEGEFAVALRSGLLVGHRAHLFAGGGIVAGSQPDQEFEETRIKLMPMMRALTPRGAAS